MIYAGCMRYPDSGGLSAEGRARREIVRLQAAQMFEHEVRPVQVARRLQVSAKPAYQWRAALARWRPGGAGVEGSGRRQGRAAGPVAGELEQGPAAHGWDEGQRRVRRRQGRSRWVRAPRPGFLDR